jgi:hypothetical protein
MLTCYTELVQALHCTMSSDHCRKIANSYAIGDERRQPE